MMEPGQHLILMVRHRVRAELIMLWFIYADLLVTGLPHGITGLPSCTYVDGF